MMLVFIAVALLLWLVIGGIVAMLVCPLLKEPADRRREPQEALDFLPTHDPVARTLLTIDKELR